MTIIIDKLVHELGETLLRTCVMYLNDLQLAEDAVQDTFIKVYQNYSKFNNKSSIKTWVTRIAINVCKDYLRKNKVDIIDGDNILNQISSNYGVEGIIEDNQLVEVIMGMPVKYKDVIILYYYLELKTKEIANVLAVPNATVSIRLKRAKELLKFNLKGWDIDE